jgi:hypothetical protein
VTFKLTKLEQAILDKMLRSFNLIADVFQIRDLTTLKGQMADLTDTMDELNDHLKIAAEDKVRLAANQEARDAWVQERREINQKRKARNIQELPESDVDTAVPKERPTSKHPIIWHTYQYHAKSAALRTAMEEEKTKISALGTLGNT